jgi:hypothetical protein
MNENIKWGAAAVAVVGLAVGAVVFRDKWWTDREEVAEKPLAPVPAHDPEPVLAAPEEPAIKHPVPSKPAEAPLPKLADSDKPVRGALATLFGEKAVEQFVLPNDVVRHMVVTIDNLPNEKVAERLRPVKPTPGYFVVDGSEESPVLHPTNFDRYKPLVQLIQTSDTKMLVAAYSRHYPLFQEAYESLGHPPEYFNDRLIEVIDHLLATPDLKGPIALARPSVMYVYADPELEARSAGQKLLIRMGTENAAAVKDKLRELRAELVARASGG